MPYTEDTPIATRAPNESLALMLGGGGARGAYQAGVLRAIANRHPSLRLPILTGISAGAVNTTFLAAQAAPLPESTEQLVRLWLSLTPDQVYNVHALPLLGNVGRWGMRLVGGGNSGKEPTRGLLDTAPLQRFLQR